MHTKLDDVSSSVRELAGQTRDLGSTSMNNANLLTVVAEGNNTITTHLEKVIERQQKQATQDDVERLRTDVSSLADQLAQLNCTPSPPKEYKEPAEINTVLRENTDLQRERSKIDELWTFDRQELKKAQAQNKKYESQLAIMEANNSTKASGLTKALQTSEGNVKRLARENGWIKEQNDRLTREKMLVEEKADAVAREHEDLRHERDRLDNIRVKNKRQVKGESNLLTHRSRAN